MYLRYSKAIADTAAVVLTRGGLRIEIFVLANNDTSYTLVALSGPEDDCHQRSKLQGPYQLRDQALAARSAVVAALQDKGFVVSGHAHSQWRLSAQRCIRAVRQLRQQHVTDCRFDPKDVL